jgi:hypothetical protein
MEVQVMTQGRVSSQPLSTIKPGFNPKRQALTFTDAQRLDLCGTEALPIPPKVLDFSSPELAFKDMGPAGYGIVIIGFASAGTALLYTGTGTKEVITTRELIERDSDETYGMGWRPNFPGKFVVHINAEHEGDVGGFIQHTPSEQECVKQYILTPKAEAERARVNLDLRLVNVGSSIYLAFVLTEDCHGTPEKPIMLAYSYGHEYWSKSIPQLLSKAGESLERSTYTYIPPNEFYFSNSDREEDTPTKPVRIKNLYGYALGNYARLIDPDLTGIHEKINNLFASSGFIPSPFGCLFLNNTFIITHEKVAIVEVKIEEATSEFRACYLPITEPAFKWESPHDANFNKITAFLKESQKTLEIILAKASWEGAPEKSELKPHINQLTEHLYKFAISQFFRTGRATDAQALLTVYDAGMQKQSSAISEAATVFHPIDAAPHATGAAASSDAGLDRH